MLRVLCLMGSVPLAACSFSGSSSAGGQADAAVDVAVADAAVDANPEAWFDPFLARRSVLVDNTTRGEIVDFPVLVRLPALGASIDETQFRVVADDHATGLPYEIEQLRPMASSTVWVRVTLPAGASLRFWVYYGTLSPLSDGSDPASVFSAYAGVYHFSDNFDSEAATPTADSSGNGRDLDAISLSAADDRVVANIGGGVEIDRGDTEFFQGQEVVSDFQVGDNEQKAVDVWFRAGETATLRYTIFDFENNCQGLAAKIDADQNDRMRAIFDVGANCQGGIDPYTVESGNDIDDDQWHHMALEVDRVAGEFRLYLDGTLADTDNNVPATGNTGGRELRVGEDGGTPGQEFDGIIDELRLGPMRSTDWWDATYASQRPPPMQTMVVVGTEQTR